MIKVEWWGTRAVIIGNLRIKRLTAGVIAEPVAERGPLWPRHHQVRLAARPRPTRAASCADIIHVGQLGLVKLLADGPPVEILADVGCQGLGAAQTGGRVVTPPQSSTRTPRTGVRLQSDLAQSRIDARLTAAS
ncbi:hypothetical protein ABT275_35430 [Streptomyces sp. NPDC001185]|uniref:hypothetical protein n=1 Tax=Streptomyces sp. NPDC001185 TaxID=3154380 RepID=UPI003327C0BE